ncbi:hypothetical protein BKA67DRAFT_64995 [Truncatella angustata]|uniref:DUF7730 domain-containing protein n=1 Tax=Truncatella angustata TaxID=152316 RepID=A0A9P8UZ47_9PEZI|nr:uncharacterized protein BKA67DRAFT_64995 [Truncatella angustata]KAH6660765.1 hypothetical protein BKA67DRAFT_64995 [Truncatella angustata]
MTVCVKSLGESNLDTWSNPGKGWVSQVSVASVEEPVSLAPNTRQHVQDQRSFLRNIPPEIRNVIYEYLWSSRGREYHIYHKNGQLLHAPCVMYPRDNDMNSIQREMDRVYESPAVDMFKESSLQMWHKRLTSDWGHRHWRCKERLHLDASRSSGREEEDKTDWMGMLLVCKQMYLEVMKSILEYHVFLCSDLTSVYWFFVLRRPPLLRNIRYVDINFAARSYEYLGFLVSGGTEQATKTIPLLAILTSLEQTKCLHDLRISFDVLDTDYRTRVDTIEESLLSNFSTIKVLKIFIVETPGIHTEEHVAGNRGSLAKYPFSIQRRPIVRYTLVNTVPPLSRRVHRAGNWKPAVISKRIR